MKGVVAFPGSRRELDPHGIDQIFTFWAASAPDTPLKGVRELPPGRYLRVSADGIEEKIYWELSFAEDTRPGGSNASKEAEEILSLLSDAVRLRLGADAPVAGYLSGGLDSSLIAALAKKTNTSFETFSIGFSDPRFDETHERNFAAASLGLPNHSVVSTPAAVAESFEGAVYSAERPVLRPAFVPMKALSASARAGGFKAVIAGEGADEFFLGYDIFKEAKIRSWCARLPRSRRRPRLLSRLYADLPLSGETRESFFRKFFLWDDDRPSEGLFSTHAARWGSASRMKRFYSKSFKDALDGYDASETLASRLPAAYRGWGPVARAQYLEATLFLSGYLLSSQGDRVSMANGVEVRYPYLDHRLVELANRLPASVKMAGLRDKRLLRSAASGVLPEEIAERPKRPYKAPPLSACLTERLTRHLSPERILRTGIFDETLTGKLLEKAKAAGATLGDSDASALCGIVSAQIFHERFVEGGVA
jgi:asparagine synthase (glutamine-hydrolysing)